MGDTYTRIDFSQFVKRPVLAVVMVLANLCILASGVISLGIIAYFTAHAQFAKVGVAYTLYTLLCSFSGPVRAKLLTMNKPYRPLMVMAVLYCGCICSAIYIFSEHFSFLLGLLVIGVSAMCIPPSGSFIRALWPKITVNKEELRAISTVDSFIGDFAFAASPLISTVIWGTLGSSWIAPLGSLVTLGLTLLLISAGLGNKSIRKYFQSGDTGDGGDAGDTRDTRDGDSSVKYSYASKMKNTLLFYRNKSIVGLLMPLFGCGAAMGALIIILPERYSRTLGHPELSGIITATFCFAGPFFTLFSAKISHRISDRRQFQISAMLVILAMVLFAVSVNLFENIFAAVIIGAGMAIMFINSYQLINVMKESQSFIVLNATLGSMFNFGEGSLTLITGFTLTRLPEHLIISVITCLIMLSCACAFLIHKNSINYSPDSETSSLK